MSYLSEVPLPDGVYPFAVPVGAPCGPDDDLAVTVELIPAAQIEAELASLCAVLSWLPGVTSGPPSTREVFLAMPCGPSGMRVLSCIIEAARVDETGHVEVVAGQ